MDDLSGKVAVVTGGASGIGLGIARALVGRGTHVVVADIEEARAEEAADGLATREVRAIAVGCDVTDRASLEGLADRAWQEFGHVELLCNNAGVFPPSGPLLEAKESDARWVFDVNVLGVFLGCRVFGPRFVDQGTPAHIVNTGSETSMGLVGPNVGMYMATKHAVLALSDTLRTELPDHVGVSILCPGSVSTDIQMSTRNRHERYGGSATRTAPPRRPGFGLEPDEVGTRVVEGVERGDFYILTHPPVVEFARERWEEINQAFQDQAPRFEGDERLDSRAMLRGRPRS
jgi:NAD(P)-dependent dehydrogenase (short-subunit alcohol dehydrogenase family)